MLKWEMSTPFSELSALFKVYEAEGEFISSDDLQIKQVSKNLKSTLHVKEGLARKPLRTKIYKSDRLLETNVQFFLTCIIDIPICSNEGYLGIRYSRTTEVRNILHKITTSTLTVNDILNTHPNILLSEVLQKLPLSFDDEELIFSSTTPDELLLIYIRGMIDTISKDCASTLYLICKALKKLSFAGVSQAHSLTDILISFTPLIFPRCCGFVSLVRATRTLLLMLDEPDEVFKTHLIEKSPSAYEFDELFEHILDEEESELPASPAGEIEQHYHDYKLYHDTRDFYTLTFDEM